MRYDNWRSMFIPEGAITILWLLSEDNNNWGGMFHTQGGITLLWLLSWDDDSWRSQLHIWGGITMLWSLAWEDASWPSTFHTWGGYHHALTVGMRGCQLMEHVSYLRGISPCSYHCHWKVITDTLLWPFKWWDDNCGSMFHTLGITNHALTVLMRWWQLTEHGSYIRGITMSWPLSFDDENCRSMLHTLGINNHALFVVMGWWQVIEHVL